MHLFAIAVPTAFPVPSTSWPIVSIADAGTDSQIAATIGSSVADVPHFDLTTAWPAVEAAAQAYEAAHQPAWLNRLLQVATAGQLATTWDYGATDPLPQPLLAAYLQANHLLPAGTPFTATWLATRPLIVDAAQEFTRLLAAGADATAILPALDHYAGMTIRELAWQMSIDIEELELPEALAAADQPALAAGQAAFAAAYPGFTFTLS